MSYFCKSVFLNVSTFNPIHSGSLLFLEVDSSSECFMTAIAEGLLSESGWIITLNNSVNSWESTCGIRGNLFSLIPWHWSPFLRRAQTSSTDNCEGKCKISAFGRWYNSPVKLYLWKEKKRPSVSSTCGLGILVTCLQSRIMPSHLDLLQRQHWGLRFETWKYYKVP